MLIIIWNIYAVQCGQLFGPCRDGSCCSKFGFCGDNEDFCEINAGCQTQYGYCWGICAPLNGRCVGTTDCCSLDGWCGTSNEHCNPTPLIKSCVNPKHAHIMVDAPLRIPQYVEAFNSYNISGSFFVSAESYASINEVDLDLLLVVDNNHEIGLISSQTQSNVKLTPSLIYNTIKPNIDIIRYVSGVAPIAYLPNSFENGTYLQAAEHLGMPSLYNPSNVYHNSEELIDSIITNSSPLLMALDNDYFLQALPAIIEYYKFKKLQFVALSTCLNKPKTQFPYQGIRPRIKSNRVVRPFVHAPTAAQYAPYNQCNNKQVSVAIEGGPSIYFHEYLKITKDLGIPISFFPSADDTAMVYNREALELSRHNQFGIQVSFNLTFGLDKLEANTTHQQHVTQKLTHNNGDMFLFPNFDGWNTTTLQYWNNLGFTVVGANLDSQDWNVNTTQTTLLESISEALEHDSSTGYIFTCIAYSKVCIDAFPRIVGLFLQHDYEFVNMTTCLSIKGNTKIINPHPTEYNSDDTSVVSGAVRALCGPKHNNQKCDANYCCSIFGTCGLSKDYCYGDYFCGWNCKGDEPPVLAGALEEPITSCKKDKTVALTFDDGPHANYTDMYLDVLKQRNIKATFFVCGYNLINNQKQFFRTRSEGHEIAHHTWNHTDPQILIKDSQGFDLDMNSTADLLYELTGKHAYFFRPPYGSFNQETLDRWHKLGMLPINWDINSYDWKNPTKYDMAFNNIVADFNLNTNSGHIVLCHDIIPTCLTHLDMIIDLFLSNNYTFVTMSECLELEPWQESPHPPHIESHYTVEYPTN
eukprot:NODE_47_length_27404_cov_0.284270.p3 type:complete len:808 gc:universal NODE_47_length_27404_cov_0.284270:18383-20806(+)